MFTLCLTYVDQGSLHPILSFGLDEERHRLLAEGGGTGLLYAHADESLGFIDEVHQGAQLP